MRRRSVLRARSRLVRRTPLRLRRAVRPAPADLTDEVGFDVRLRVFIRSGGFCEARLAGCGHIAVEIHHRVSRKVGGRHGAARRRHDRLSNLLHLCPPCHRWVTGHPAESYVAGWSLREHLAPAQEPVLYRGVASFLDDRGAVVGYEVPA